ncbi:YbhB/YbcL family Raf kinase inhibitor-like protein [Paludibacterium sp.]|uniref:YbhB/YbcL family Raf kinase inhibitor-like protein n=1 Tax=Paludibacterium sp. TaxID=1917523 RepID=UPI0025E4872C|nr:YbhB/YbcL family Raf kinase inhibitor-like protein [Paludibacterium sp.]MBV8649323.1 YbhB/YbcL family Raf kinase inhibitor-like protein [Paludibacterium sp.]
MTRARRLAWLVALPLSYHAAAFSLTSPDIADGQPLSLKHVYNRHSCQGDNRSPALAWRDAPAGTRSFALTVFDPDARAGLGWWHWAVYDLPAGSRGLAAGAGSPGGALPVGTQQARTSFGENRYGGACPPVGDPPHHYQFTLWALDVAKLGLAADADGPALQAALKSHLLGQARLTPIYGR